MSTWSKRKSKCLALLQGHKNTWSLWAASGIRYLPSPDFCRDVLSWTLNKVFTKQKFMLLASWSVSSLFKNHFASPINTHTNQFFCLLVPYRDIAFEATVSGWSQQIPWVHLNLRHPRILCIVQVTGSKGQACSLCLLGLPNMPKDPGKNDRKRL